MSRWMLPETLNDKVKQAVSAYPEIVSIRLFGSRVRQPESDRDYDLAVKLDPQSYKDSLRDLERLVMIVLAFRPVRTLWTGYALRVSDDLALSGADVCFLRPDGSIVWNTCAFGRKVVIDGTKTQITTKGVIVDYCRMRDDIERGNLLYRRDAGFFPYPGLNNHDIVENIKCWTDPIEPGAELFDALPPVQEVKP